MVEILNENWVNIQEPVREMFIALSKVRIYLSIYLYISLFSDLYFYSLRASEC